MDECVLIVIAAVNSSGVEQSMYQLMVGTIALCSLVIIIDLVAIIYACRKAYTTYSDGLYKHRSELTICVMCASDVT